MKKILLVAQDTAPSDALRLLSDRLVHERRLDTAGETEIPVFTTVSFLAGGKDFLATLAEILSHVADCNAVVVGMSSSEALSKEEFAVAREAIRLGKPVFCYADTFGLRPYFKDVLDAPGTTLFHLNDDEADVALTTYPMLQVVTTGNPMWEKFFFPKFTRDAVRERLGISEGVKVVLCPGGKDAAINILHFTRAVEEFPCAHSKTVVILSLHGGDKTDPLVYTTLKDYAPLGVIVKIIPSKEMSGSDILPGVDLVYASASTIEIEAVCQRIPVASYISSIARRRLRKTTGNDVWELTEQGVSFNVEDYGTCNPARLLAGMTDYRTKYEELYPKPEKLGVALDKMVTAIEAKIG